MRGGTRPGAGRPPAVDALAVDVADDLLTALVPELEAAGNAFAEAMAVLNVAEDGLWIDLDALLERHRTAVSMIACYAVGLRLDRRPPSCARIAELVGQRKAALSRELNAA